MKAQHIDLSPRKILSYLKDFESRLPRLNSNYYIPLIVQQYYTDELLNAEVSNMCTYLGVNGYTPSCHFVDLPKDCGGDI